MFSVNQALLYGKLHNADKHVSDGRMYQKLAGKTDIGKVPVYGMYFESNSNPTKAVVTQ